MTEWKEYKLGEIASFKTGKLNSNAAVENGIYPFFTCSPITYAINEYAYNQKAILLAGNNAEGNFSVKYYEGKFNAYQRTYIIESNKGICDLKFLYYSLKLCLQEFKHISQGTSTKFLTSVILNNFSISLPPLPEQHRIAAILSSLDDKIDLLHRENATLEQMAETLFKQWFVVEAKEEWEEKELREIVDISIGRTPPRKETKWFSTNPSDVKWLSIKDMGAGDVFLFNTSEYLTKEAVETFSIPIIPKDTVVLSFKMTVGRVGITTEDMLSNEAIAHFKFTNKTPITKEYLYLFLKSFKYDSLGSTSSIVTAINSAMIKQMQIIIPDEMIMKKFEEQTQYIFDKIYSNQKQIQTLIQQRDSLLPKLMSGEVKI